MVPTILPIEAVQSARWLHAWLPNGHSMGNCRSPVGQRLGGLLSAVSRGLGWPQLSSPNGTLMACHVWGAIDLEAMSHVYVTMTIVSVLLVWTHDVPLALTTDQWSAVGSMLGGLGSILAVIAAASLLAVEIRGRRIEARRYAQERRELAAEQRERDARQRDSDASLARLVIAETGDFIRAVDGEEGERDLWITVWNHSTSFVFDVLVRIPGTPVRRLIHFIKPGESEKADFRSLSYDYHVLHLGCGGPLSPTKLRITLEFTDPSGRRWRREGWDPPVRLPDALADPALYRYMSPVVHSESPYDQALEQFGLQMLEGSGEPQQ